MKKLRKQNVFDLIKKEKTQAAKSKFELKL